MGESGLVKGLDLEIARGKAAFERGRKESRVLAPYDSTGALIAALAVSECDRGDLIAALIRRTRGADAPAFWRALLLRAFVPLMARLGRGRRGDRMDNVQHAAVAFLGAVGAFDEERHGGRAAKYLLGKTRQLLHKATRREGGRETPVEIDDEDERFLQDAPDLGEALVLRDVLLRSPGGVEVLRLMYATLGEEQSFREYVRDQHGVLAPAEEERHVVRLQRVRHRAAERAREAISAWRDMIAPLAVAA